MGIFFFFAGVVQVVQWAIENGCPWDKRVRDFVPTGACGVAALQQVDELFGVAAVLLFSLVLLVVVVVVLLSWVFTRWTRYCVAADVCCCRYCAATCVVVCVRQVEIRLYSCCGGC